MKRIFFLIVWFGLLSCSGDSAHAQNRMPVAGVAIPLGGNSYITSGPEVGKIEENGITGWSNSETVFSTYFRVNCAGSIDLYLKYSTDAGGNQIQVTCHTDTFKVELADSSGAETVSYLGTVDCSEGYVRVDLKGIHRNGDFYCTPSALIVDGMEVTHMSYVGDFSYYWGRRGPSVHMSYEIPGGVTAEWFYNEVTVPEGEDPVGSYFMANGFGEGYFGIQVNSISERRVLFSVWSPYETDNPTEIPQEHRIKLMKKGKDVYTGEFGNEGSGGQSYLRYNWKAGVTYGFLTRVRPAEMGYSEYTSYFYAPEKGHWMLIAQFMRPGTNTYYTRPHSFLENFDPSKGYLNRKACYGNQWVFSTEGKWVELRRGRFTADATAQAGARMDYRGGVEENCFFLQNGGFLDNYVSMGGELMRASSGKRPAIDWNNLER